MPGILFRFYEIEQCGLTTNVPTSFSQTPHLNKFGRVLRLNFDFLQGVHPLSFRPSPVGGEPAFTRILSRRHPISHRMIVWLLVFTAFAILRDTGLFGTAGLFGTTVRAAVEGPAATADDEGAPVHVDEPTATGHAAGEEEHAGGHADPVAPILLAIILILFLAKLGGDLFERMGMPAVLGELVVGIVLGNFALLTGWEGLDFLRAPPAGVAGDPYAAGAVLKMLAGIGVVLLLFEVGLESNVREMMSVGVSSLLVAVLGVVAPMLLGWGSALVLIPEQGWQTHVFIGATLCATSVGITARVLKDLGRSQQRESQIILGAAVIDDVLGLIILAIVSGVIAQSRMAGGPEAAGGTGALVLELVKIIALSFGFLAAAVFLGTRLITRPVFKAASYLRGHGMLVATALVICFGFAWLANVVGLAPIVGAFAAGLILERAHYQELGRKENVELEEALAPLTALLVPIFFVQMGIQVDLASFREPSVWGLAAAITIGAIVGKQVCAFGVREKGLNRFAVGLGMIPRGEVGLIFADQGAKLGVVNDGTFSAVVVMVIFTSMVTPPLLKWALMRGESVPEETPNHTPPRTPESTQESQKERESV